MRTKALVLAAAVGALSVASSQAVNSVNVVGYINKTCTASGLGLTLVANQLKVGGNTIAEVIPAPPMATICYFWSHAINDFVLLDYFGAWLYDDGGAPGDGFLVPPGTPFFVLNQSGADFTMTFVGDVPQTPADAAFFSTTMYANAYTMVASAAPVSKPINDPVYSFPSTVGMNLLKFDIGIQDYLTYSFFDQWYNPEGQPGVPTIDVGEGFFILDQAGADIPWAMTFTVN